MRRSGGLRYRAAIGICICAFAKTSSADPLVAAFWSRPEHDDDALFVRVRGQVSDLPLRVVRVDGARAPSMGEQLEQAEAVARRSGADAVAWFETAAAQQTVLVVVAQPHGGRVLVRRIHANSRAVDMRTLDSSTLETAALVMRTSLRALAEGGAIGIAREEWVPAASPAAPAESRGTAPPAPPAPDARRPLHGLAGVGWRSTYDGSALDQGLDVRVGVGQNPWALGIGATPSLAASRRVPYATFDLASDRVVGFGSIEFFHHRPFSLETTVSAGVVLFRRVTVAAFDGARPTPSALAPSFVTSAAVALTWLPAFDRRAGLRIGAGCDVLPSPPAFGYQTRGAFSSALRLWAVQPSASLSLEFRAFE